MGEVRAQPATPSSADSRAALDLDTRRAGALHTALYEIAELSASGLDLGRMLARMHSVLAGLMYAPNLLIALYDASASSLRFVYFVDAEDPEVIDPAQTFSIADLPNSLTLAVIRQGRPLMGPSTDLVRELGIVVDRMQGPSCEHWLGVPVLAGGEVRGAVVVQSYDPAVRYSEADRDLLAYVAHHIFTALLRRQAQDELERRVEQRTHELAESNRSLQREVMERKRSERLQVALFRIADLASSELAFADVLGQVHAVIADLMYAENFFIALYEREREVLRYVYFADSRDEMVPDPAHEIPAARMENSLTMGLIRHGRALMGSSEHVYAQLGRVRDENDPSIGPVSEDWLGVPMVLDGEVRGVVVVQSYEPEIRFSEADRDLLGYVARHILTALLRHQERAELERRVEQRTRELAEAVSELRGQIRERERIESRLKHDILHDGLTGLPNRASLLDSLGRALRRASDEPNFRYAVLFLDLDRFKIVNDSVGHLIGDEMLKEAGRRLAACVRAPDLVARLGGDEFAILLEQIDDEGTVERVAHRVLEAMRKPMLLDGKEVFTSTSIGVAMSHARYHRAEELLRDADVAMYRAKERGRQRFEMFDEALHREALRILDLEGDLRRAVLRGEFEPYFQAIVRLEDAVPVGREALLRWRHPQRGVLLPADFIDVARDNGLAEQIDWQVFEAACREAVSLSANGCYVALNVGARHFRAPDIGRALLDLLARHGLAPSQVRIELTEDALLENPDQVFRSLITLREAGVRVALDDFGTGYSSLGYLHRFPFHTLKIDRSFVADLGGDRHGASEAVVRTILALADALAVEVVAEGVETERQRECLRALGCRLGQGFLFDRPAPASPASV